MTYLFQIFLFILFGLTYFFIFRCLLGAILNFIGVLMGIILRIKYGNLTSKEILHGKVFLIVILESLLKGGFTLGCLIYIYIYNLWSSTYIHIWENNFLLALLSLSLIFEASSYQSDNAIIRRVSRPITLGIPSLLILILIIILSIYPDLFNLTTFKWAVITSGIVFIIILPFGYLLATSIYKYSAIENRYEVVNDSLKQLQTLAQVVGDSEDWIQIKKAIQHVEELSLKTIQSLKNENFKQADIYIVQAEVESKTIKRLFQERISVSLPDELRNRINYSIKDVDELITNFQSSQTDTAKLEELLKTANYLKTEVDKLVIGEVDFSSKVFLDQLKPFEAFFREVVEIRTALKVRNEFGSTVDIIKNLAEEGLTLIELARALKIQTASIIETRKSTLKIYEHFRYGNISNSEELVDAYYKTQKALKLLETEVNLIKENINRNWNVSILELGQIYVYTPQTVSTTDFSICAILLRPSNLENLTVQIGGTLLELPSISEIKMIKDINPTVIRSFSIAGKKGGKANLTLSFQDDKNLSFTESISINVLLSISEIAQDAARLGVLFGGISLVVSVITVNFDVPKAIGIATAFASLSTLFIFLYFYWTKYRNLRR